MTTLLRRASGTRWLLAAACLGGCAPNPAPAPTPPAPDDGAVRVTLLHINDVYEITPVEGGKAGGLARIAGGSPRKIQPPPRCWAATSSPPLPSAPRG
jgi:hypothetical protein